MLILMLKEANKSTQKSSDNGHLMRLLNILNEGVSLTILYCLLTMIHTVNTIIFFKGQPIVSNSLKI